jgi:Asp-tRNA(Asn)/Glu-tRNA(Gln) amidotransferase A subunit family amidase
LCALATGSDVGGSLRNPASCCGVASVKPTFGLVPRANRTNGFRGHTPFGVLGPMARDVEGLALMLDVMAGEDRIDPFSLPKQANYREAAADPPDASELSVAYSPDLDVFAVEPEVREAVGSTLDDLESAGATVEAVTFETPEKGELTHAYSLAVTTFFATTAAEIRESLGVDITAMDTDEVPADLQTLISMGQSHDIAEYVEADFPRTDLYHAVEDALDGYDALACPTLATLPLTHEEPFPQRIDGEPTGGMPTSWMLAWPFNMTGHPVVNVPAEPVDGLPVGRQLVGGTFSEPRLLGVARAVEETSPWGSPGE